jgi:hypothetical protein
MIIQYLGYNKPKFDTICVGMCYFSPAGYKKPLTNLNIIIEQFQKYNIPYYIIELLYPDQKQVIPDSFVVKASSILFSKENLWNILEKKIPDKYDKIIFMDSDVLFNDPDWFNKSYELLQHNDLIQPMEVSYKDIHHIYDQIEIDFNNLKPPKTKISIAKALINNNYIDLTYHHTGFGLGIDRNFFHKIKGFFEYCITGTGDLAFWASFLPNYQIDSPHLHNNVLNKYLNYKNNIYQYYIYPKRISYVEQCVALHLYHGQRNNRQYNTRHKYLPISCDYYHNEYGVLELTNIISNNHCLIDYWITRKEDE